MPVVHIESSEQLLSVLSNNDGFVHNFEYVFVDFYADWCGPCKRVAPVLEDMSERYANKILFLKVNIEECMDAANAYQIQSLPTFMIFDNGEIKSSYQPIIGANIAVIEERLKSLVLKPMDKISDDF
jgi:thioredoxin 1